MFVSKLVTVCTYRQSIRQLVKAEGGGQHGGADGEAGAAGIAALASRASGRIPPTLPAGNFWLLLDHQDLVIAKVTQQRVVWIWDGGKAERRNPLEDGQKVEDRRKTTEEVDSVVDPQLGTRS